MDLEQVTGRLRRLREELDAARDDVPSGPGLVDRLVQEIAQTEQAIAAGSTRMPALAENVVVRPEVRRMPVLRQRMTPFGPRLEDPVME